MAIKQDKKLKQKYSMGEGYFIPDSMDVREWRKLKKQWDRKLEAIGFIDIEASSPDASGFVSPYFSQRHGFTLPRAASSTFIKQDVADYYSALSTFQHYVPVEVAIYAMEPVRGMGPKQVQTVLERLLPLYLEGYTLKEIWKTELSRTKVSYSKVLEIWKNYDRYFKHIINDYMRKMGAYEYED